MGKIPPSDQLKVVSLWKGPPWTSVLECVTEEAEKATESNSLRSISSWPVLQFLPPAIPALPSLHNGL